MQLKYIQSIIYLGKSAQKGGGTHSPEREYVPYNGWGKFPRALSGPVNLGKVNPSGYMSCQPMVLKRCYVIVTAVCGVRSNNEE